MATGTGNLPYPGKVYNPFDILTAEELNEDVANIESLADGSGIGDGSIPNSAIADGAVTNAKLNLSSAAVNYVATSQTTSSTSYTGLGTAQTLSVTIGASGVLLVGISVADCANNTANQQSRASFALSGANTVSSGTNGRVAMMQAYTNNAASAISGTYLMTGLNPGATTITMQFNVGGGTGTFVGRTIWAIPL